MQQEENNAPLQWGWGESQRRITKWETCDDEWQTQTDTAFVLVQHLHVVIHTHWKQMTKKKSENVM